MGWLRRPDRADAPRRPDMKRLWDAFGKIVRDDVLERDFLHFPAGTPATAVDAWFRIAHAELDRHVTPVVEIRSRGRLLTRRTTHAGAHLAVGPGYVRLDGRPLPDLAGRLIVGVRWIAGSGCVEAATDAPLRGMINGVMRLGTLRLR